jgi:pimeloyl-ACP methyl ester carboxylesterase
LAERVATAGRVLLLVHGIIGDTEGMAAGIRACGIDRRFDLVLTYDYENLSTPVADTARLLKADLAEAGLGRRNGHNLTLLVHSMGGLVSRWFIEREGGGELVDHLVMCGTPNLGSPFGKVDEARQVVTMLTGIAANASPPLIPFIAPLLFLLNRSSQVTPTLQQMDASSDFIRGLNASPDPGVRYTLLAGDVATYDDTSDRLFARLLAQMGRSTLFDRLFGQRRNDIAVAVDSVRAGLSARPSATWIPVSCHHLNYFSSPAGQGALTSVDW